MRIGIDIRCLMEGTRTGVEEYTVGVLERMFAEDKKNKYFLFVNSFKKIKGDLSWLEKYPNVEIKNYGFPNKLFNFLVWFFGWPKIDLLLGGVDVFFAPNISFMALSKNCKFVLTMHDLSFERFPEHFSRKRNLWHFILNPRKLCKRADLILAVSDSTKEDLVGMYGISPNKIQTVYPLGNIEKFENAGIKGDDIERLIRRYGLPEEYILFLGTIEPRKNLVSLVRAFERLRERNRNFEDLHLVLAGQVGWSYGEILEAVKKSNCKEKILFIGFVHDEDKPKLYKFAKMFVYPSFFEGYGFPPVEAMASGTPVVTSNCSSVPEVVSDAAILVDPYCPHEIMLAMELFLRNEDLCDEYKRRGIKRASDLKKLAEQENLHKYFQK